MERAGCCFCGPWKSLAGVSLDPVETTAVCTSLLKIDKEPDCEDLLFSSSQEKVKSLLFYFILLQCGNHRMLRKSLR